MPWLIDGDNLLGTWGRRRGDAERRQLFLELQRFGRRIRKQVLVVFDGPEPGPPAFGAGVRFSGVGRSADDVILELLRGESDPGGWTVVTSDKSLGDQCRWIGAAHERSDRFRARLRSSPEEEKPESEDDVDYWLERFGETDDEES